MVAPEGSVPGALHAVRPMPGSSAIVVEMAGRFDRAEIPAICERVRVALKETRADLVVCDVADLADPDCVAVDAVARIQLTVMRLGRRVVLHNVSAELRALFGLVGLGEVVEEGSTSGVEPGRQPE